MPKKRNSKKKNVTTDRPSIATTSIPSREHLIPLLDTLEFYNAGLKAVNGKYLHKQLDGDFYERIVYDNDPCFEEDSKQKEEKTSAISDPVAALLTNDDKTITTNEGDKAETKAAPSSEIAEVDKSANTKSAPSTKAKKVYRFEIEFQQFSKSTNDVPHKLLNKSGCWILSRVDIHPKKILYGSNCPLKDKFPTSNWFTIAKDDINPPPKIRVPETKSNVDAIASEKELKKQNKRAKQKHKKQETDEHDNGDNDNDDGRGDGDDDSEKDKEEENDDTTALVEKQTKKKEEVGSQPINVRPSQHWKDQQRALLQRQQNKFASGTAKFDQHMFRDQSRGLLMVVTGGQTGVHRAAFDAAIKHHIPIGGWCPKDREAEDGVIPDIYPLQETKTTHYSERTEANVVDSDATLIINIGKLDGETQETVQCISKYAKDLMVVQLKPDVRIVAVEPNKAKWMTADSSQPSESSSAHDIDTTITTKEKEKETSQKEEITSSQGDKEEKPVEKHETNTDTVQELKEDRTKSDEMTTFADGRTLRVAEWIRLNKIKNLFFSLLNCNQSFAFFFFEKLLLIIFIAQEEEINQEKHLALLNLSLKSAQLITKKAIHLQQLEVRKYT
ncbi:hypothetical protein RFI_25982 [Reticulomyxa filosa]|uniref:Uncharacterized protein n=1 Tax=Reticulomyxa filosa TaxID=46433 RepID=X6MC29_RETFI|nr:hypothetical protein RFI_25982 [Reticulomyxa filosa]|eukprot:ETO11394.1 hypothetical protein RFI_25982 [Reticulomyxa filosa]